MDKGSRFWACATRTCQFFLWKDQPKHSRPNSVVGNYNRSGPGNMEPSFTPSTSSGSARPLAERPRCRCENVAALDRWGGGGPNNGRKHWRCQNGPKARCEFFEWVRDEREVEGIPLADPFNRSNAQNRSQPQRRNTTGAQAQESQDGGARGGECFKVGSESSCQLYATHATYAIVQENWPLGQRFDSNANLHK